jgi:hypothetical protein
MNGLRRDIFKSRGSGVPDRGGYEILERQDFVTGALKILQKILTHKPRFPERKILFAPLRDLYMLHLIYLRRKEMLYLTCPFKVTFT